MSATLSAAVGTGAANAAADARTVQRLLVRAAELAGDPALHPGPVDGVVGDGTEGAIARMQRRAGLRPDGRVDPGGYTWARLWALLAVGDVPWGPPIDGRPAQPFVGPGAGMRSFGWRRGRGRRAHAGVDLYAPVGTPVRAVAAGVVRRAAPFYCRTDAVEVVHSGAAHGAVGGGAGDGGPGGAAPFVARYGEVDAAVTAGDRVAAGDVVGTVGQMVLGDGRPFTIGGRPAAMLHFELYDGTSEGALTDRSTRCARHTDGRPFYRRRDLVDPSAFVARALGG